MHKNMKRYPIFLMVFFKQIISTVIAQSHSISQFNMCGCEIHNFSKTVCELYCLSQLERDQISCTVWFESVQDSHNKTKLICMRRNVFLILEEKGGPYSIVSFQCQARTRMDFNFDGALPHQTLQLSFYRDNFNRLDENMEHVLRGSMQSEPGIAGRYTIRTEVDHENASVYQISFDVYVKYVEGGPYLQHNHKSLSPVIVSKTTFVLPCIVLIKGLAVELKKDGDVFTGFKSYKPKIGYIVEVPDGNLEAYFGQYQCIPNLLTLDNMIPKPADMVKIKVDSKTLSPLTEYFEKTGISALNFNNSGNLFSCSSLENGFKDYHLVDLKLRNPSELPLKKDCLPTGINCVGKKEANFSSCTQSFRSCKSLEITEGGGITSCFKANDFATSKSVQEYIYGLNRILYFDPTPESIPIDALLRVEVSGNEDKNLCTNVLYNISCAALSYLVAQPLEMSVVFSNQSRLPIHSIQDTIDDSFVSTYSDILKVSTQIFLKLEGITRVSCTAFRWNSEESLQKTVVLKSVACILPVFVSRKENITIVSGQINQLECDYESVPRSSIVWEKDGYVISGKVERILSFSDVTQETAGVYTCITSNVMGSANKTFTVNVKEEDGSYGPLYTIGIPCLVTALCLIFCLLLLRYYRNKKAILSKEEYMEFKRGIALSNPAQDGGNDDFTATVPYHKEYEIHDKDFSLDETKLLGCGAYGMVYQGKVGTLDVAIKTLRRTSEISYLRSLISELKVMIYLQNHPHLVNLYGANTKNLRNGSLFLIVEMCPLGDLQNYLRKNRKNYQDEFCKLAYCNAPNTINLLGEHITTRDLLTWSIQICSGMEYLSSKKVIHGDLAARNVLLQDTRTAKISDFGLSRKLYEYSNYMKQSKEPLPWRHMAIESLRDLKFSTESDVWAFGVTMWEIFSLGEVPYPGLIGNFDFVRSLENGLRMKRAKCSNQKIYDISVRCWCDDSTKRPTFNNIKLDLETLLHLLCNEYNKREEYVDC